MHPEAVPKIEPLLTNSNAEASPLEVALEAEASLVCRHSKGRSNCSLMPKQKLVLRTGLGWPVEIRPETQVLNCSLVGFRMA